MSRNYDNWLAGYAYHSRHAEAPDIYHFWTGVFTIAAVLRRQVWNDQRIFEWTPNFYIVLVGPAGIIAKSTSLDIGTKLLERVDGIHFGPNSMTWQGLTTSFEESYEMTPYGDEFLPMSPISCSISELGTFLRPDDKDLVSLLTDLWDGKKIKWKRMTASVEGRKEIVNPWINMMGCTTPSWIRDNIPESMIGGGLISRIVFVYAEEKRHLTAYPADAYDLDDFTETGDKLVEDLRHIAKLVGEFKFTPNAKAWGTEWYAKHWEKRPAHMISDRYGPYIARKQTHIHKLAMVLSAARRDDLLIHKDDLYTANVMMTGLEVSMQKVFQSIGSGDISRMVVEMLAYVRAYKEISQRELWRYLMMIMDPKQFTEATDAAVKAGYVKLVQRGSTIFYCAIFDNDETGENK